MTAATAADLVGSGQPGIVYLLHFDEPFGHARHYLGWARPGQLEARLAAHGKARGSALMRAVRAAGIGWQLARTWPGDRYRERQLKTQGGHSRKCPICRAAGSQAALFDPTTTTGGHMTTTMTTTTTPVTGGGVLRDQWGRYLIPDPATGETRAWTRATTLARTLADRTVLEAWDQRNIVLGIGARQDLYAQAAACTPTETATLNEIVAQAKTAAAAQAGANTGSALHRFTERLDAGEDLDVPEPWDRDIAAYRDRLRAHQITMAPGWLERVLVIPAAGAAGTCDRLLCAPGWDRPRIGDLKTAKDPVRYGTGEIAIQLALYAHATHWYDPTTGELHHIDPDAIDRTRALVMHLPAGQGTCTLLRPRHPLRLGRRRARPGRAPLAHPQRPRHRAHTRQRPATRRPCRPDGWSSRPGGPRGRSGAATGGGGVMPSAKTATAIRFDPELHERLRVAADERDLSINFLVNLAVRELLPRLIAVDEIRWTKHPTPSPDRVLHDQRCRSRFSLGGGTPVRCLEPAGHPPPHEYAPDDDSWVVIWADTAATCEPGRNALDVAAEEVCRGIQLHRSHNGALPWPSIRRPYERWLQLATRTDSGTGDPETSS